MPRSSSSEESSASVVFKLTFDDVESFKNSCPSAETFQQGEAFVQGWNAVVEKFKNDKSYRDLYDQSVYKQRAEKFTEKDNITCELKYVTGSLVETKEITNEQGDDLKFVAAMTNFGRDLKYSNIDKKDPFVIETLALLPKELTNLPDQELGNVFNEAVSGKSVDIVAPMVGSPAGFVVGEYPQIFMANGAPHARVIYQSDSAIETMFDRMDMERAELLKNAKNAREDFEKEASPENKEELDRLMSEVNETPSAYVDVGFDSPSVKRSLDRDSLEPQLSRSQSAPATLGGSQPSNRSSQTSPPPSPSFFSRVKGWFGSGSSTPKETTPPPSPPKTPTSTPLTISTASSVASTPLTTSPTSMTASSPMVKNEKDLSQAKSGQVHKIDLNWLIEREMEQQQQNSPKVEAETKKVATDLNAKVEDMREALLKFAEKYDRPIAAELKNTTPKPDQANDKRIEEAVKKAYVEVCKGNPGNTTFMAKLVTQFKQNNSDITKATSPEVLKTRAEKFIQTSPLTQKRVSLVSQQGEKQAITKSIGEGLKRGR